jgi:hypothetical protein
MATKSIAQEEGIDMNTPEITTHVVVTSEACGSTASRTECKRPTCTVKIETSTSTDLKKSDKGGNSAHRAAVAYFRCAAMFFGAMVITWVCLFPLNTSPSPSYYILLFTSRSPFIFIIPAY